MPLIRTEAGRPAWHQARLHGLGASDTAAILGLSPWRTPKQVWAEKLQLVEPEDAGPAAEAGLRLEPFLARWYQDRTGHRLRDPGGIHVHPEYPCLRASLDRILAWDFDRVVVTHGDVLESGGKQALRQAFSWLSPLSRRAR